ncbi:DUF1217 domain-containing protein [Shimia marina]|uniref:Flagellar protein n=1 Tax=Shimia marina TaxID=321267 RepID=A0A0P1FD99_9RHOB|nr:DUF1217 domain-containing protein [Shimia marina]CUH51368.1 hypothetical protein SHM7688_00804 [Shimia marina]SFD50865.1 Protein of unknown function [Shimia marina]
MTYQPIVVGSGLVAWNFMQRTMETQTTAFENSAVVQRDLDYFAENIGKVESAEDLVNDRRLLRVALGAYGLDDDLNNKFFVQKILSDGTQADDALSNRLADKRYREFSEAFGFGDLGGPWHKTPSFVENIKEDYLARQFETAVGNQDENLRFAMNAMRELDDIALSGQSDNTNWFTVMGNPPLRKVFETAFGLPTEFGSLDLDKQLDTFRERLEDLTGNGEISQFVGTDTREAIVERFLLMSEIGNVSVASSGQIALTLLSY